MSAPKRKLQAKPQPAQIAAIEQLIHSGDHAAAQQRLHALRQTYPQYTPLLRLAWEIEAQLGQHMAATARAYDWHQVAPNSEMALSALAQSAKKQGLLVLARYAEDRLDALHGIPVRNDLGVMDGPFGPVTFQMMLTGDLSQMYNSDNNHKATIALLKDTTHPAGRNNLATAWFMVGEVQKAHDIAFATWQEFPDNLYALGLMVRWRCWLQGLDRCKGFAAPLLATRPLRSEDAIARIETLRFLDEEKLAQRAWQDTQAADFWKKSDDSQVAAFKSLKATGASMQEFAGNWLGLGWLRDLQTSMRSLPQDDSQNLSPQVNQKLLSLRAHADYLCRAIALGDQATSAIALLILKKRSLLPDTSAQAALLELLRQPKGSDKQRMDLLQWLKENALVSSSEPTVIWINGKLESVLTTNITVTSTPVKSSFAVQKDPRYGDSLDFCYQKRFKQAHALALQLFQDYPADAPAWTHLATVKEALHHPQAEQDRLFEHAFALDPGYIFARTGWAICLARQGRADEAQELLKPLAMQTEFHVTQYRSLLNAQLSVAKAMGLTESVKALTRALADLNQ